jgi:hypothetical protein
MVNARFPPMVPVAEPKLAALFAQPCVLGIAVAEVQVTLLIGTVVGRVIDLPDPLETGI